MIQQENSILVTNPKNNTYPMYCFAVLQGGKSKDKSNLLTPFLKNKKVAQLYLARFKKNYPESHIGCWQAEDEGFSTHFIDSDLREINHWADFYLIFFDNKYRFIESSTQQMVFEFQADSDTEAETRCASFIRYQGITTTEEQVLANRAEDIMDGTWVKCSQVICTDKDDNTRSFFYLNLADAADTKSALLNAGYEVKIVENRIFIEKGAFVNDLEGVA